MAYSVSGIRFGPCIVRWLSHGSGAGYSSGGEAKFDTILAESSIGITTTGATAAVEAELHEFKADQELHSLGHGVFAKTGTVSFTVLAGEAAKLARALGQASAVEKTVNSEVFETNKGIPFIPEKISLLLAQEQPNSSETDYVYIPRAQIDPSSLSTVFDPGELRTVELTFKFMASDQDMLQLPDGKSGGVMYIETTSATFDKVIKFVDTYSNAADVTVQHQRGYELGAVAVEATDNSLKLPTFEKALSAQDYRFKLEASGSGDIHMFLAGVSSEDTSVGVSEVQWVDTAASTWTITVENFAVNSSGCIALAFDQWGKLLTPNSVTYTDGAAGSGRVEFTFASNQRGRAVIIDEGPNGVTRDIFTDALSWEITGASSHRPWFIQCWDTTTGLLFDDDIYAITYAPGIYTIEFVGGETHAGTAVAIY